jgi:glycosyltransferase involved in cell wall biosynthesis
MQIPVSVCIPTYNGAKYLRECLDSVLSQTLTNFEVLIIDDQSSDTTLSIAEEYAQKDGRIRVRQNPQNLGLVENWNQCVELAQGEWIKFVFQDDLIAPTCLEKLLSACSGNDQIVFCNRTFLFEADVSQSTKAGYLDLPSPTKFFGNITRRISAREFTQAALKDVSLNIVGEPTVTLIKKDAFQRFGSFNQRLIQLCDFEYWTRIASNVGIVYVPENLASFRVHDHSTTSKNKAQKLYRLKLDRLFILAEMLSSPQYENLRSIAKSSSANIRAMSKCDGYFEWLRFQRALKRSEEVSPVEKNWQELLDSYPEFPRVDQLHPLEKAIFMVRYRLVYIQWQLMRFFKSSFAKNSG